MARVTVELDPILTFSRSAIALPAPMAVRHVRDPRGGVRITIGAQRRAAAFLALPE